MTPLPSDSASTTLSVHALVEGLAGVVEDAYSDVWVEGELSNFSRAASGHCYFTLKDSEAQIRCVMWRHLAKHVYFTPQDGMAVRVHGSASVYTRRGDLQIMATAMRQAGKGALQEAFEQLKRKLDAEGLFDDARKQPLPSFPEVIGVVTSEQGAALQDILSVLERRFPAARVVLCPVPVQGIDAAPAIAAAIATLNASSAPQRPDVLIVGRGGGSREDLWAFNEEEVARAIAASALPVVSAVGHETDVSIADLVADRRAATPSMAAEVVVPDRTDITLQVQTLSDRLNDLVTTRLRDARQRVDYLTHSRAFHRPIHQLQQHQQQLDELIRRLGRAGTRAMDRQRLRLERVQARLEALDPNAPLRRGYALVERAAQPVRRAAPLREDDLVTMRFLDGKRNARIISDRSAPSHGN